MYPDWKRAVLVAAQPAIAAKERELNARIGEVVEQIRSEMVGCPADEIFETMRARLSPDPLPDDALENGSLTSRLRAEAERISESRQIPRIRGGAVRGKPGGQVQSSSFVPKTTSPEGDSTS